MKLSPAARALIFKHEDLNQPGKWPGGGSGITLGRGYDLGHVRAAQFRADWTAHLPADHIRRLEKAVGATGQAAKALALELRDIRIAPDAADRVFDNAMVPRYFALAQGTFPAISALPPDAQGALFSLVLNRGPSLEGERRSEMRAISYAVVAGDLKEIAAQLRAMKRLWQGKGLAGLIRRREDEARLVESCIPEGETT